MRLYCIGCGKPLTYHGPRQACRACSNQVAAGGMADMEPTIIGKRIKELRLARRESQRAFGKRTGITPATIASIETGRNKSMWYSTLLRIADAFNVKIEDLVQGDEYINYG